MAELDIKQVDADAARTFWQRQGDARIFLHPDVLGPLCPQVDWWLARWNGNPVCLWPVCHSADGMNRPPELSAYVGPLWSDAVLAQKPHRWWAQSSATQQGMLELLASAYGSFGFELPPGTRDVRAVQWFAAVAAQSRAVTLEPRHTAVIASADGADYESLLAGFSRNRQRDIRSTSLEGFVEADVDDKSLFEMYESVLDGKQDAATARRRRNEVMGLIEAARNGRGRLLAFRDVDGAPAGFTLVLGSGRTALQILIACSPKARSGGLQAWIQMSAILRSFAGGAAVFDFVGGNSPVGAEEKHRYGARPEMYFRVLVSR